MKRPSFQFYPADWRKDAALQSCSLPAQGLWVNLMCIAHECEPYGHLLVNGKPMTTAQIGRLVGIAAKDADKLLVELADAGVSSTDEQGAIFSRRMVRDEDLRNRRAEGGKAGSEHGAKGAEHGLKGGRPRKVRGVSEPPIEPPPSSSSSSSSSSSLRSEIPPSPGGDAPPKVRGSRKLPENFALTPDLRAWSAQEAPLVDPDAELAKLRDHTFATARSDWPGTVRNWLRKAQEDAAARRPRGSGATLNRIDRQLQTAGLMTGAIRPIREAHNDLEAIDGNVRFIAP